MFQDIASNIFLMNSIYFVLVLIIGMIISIIAKKIMIPGALLLIVLGYFLGNFHYGTILPLNFSSSVITNISIIALVIVLFDSFSKLKTKHVDTLDSRTVLFSVFSFLLMLILFSFSALYFFKISVLNSILLSILMSGTSYHLASSLLLKKKVRTLEILDFESRLTAPITILTVLLVLELSNLKIIGLDRSNLGMLWLGIKPLVLYLLVGFGSGILIGLIGSSIIKKHYFKPILSLVLILAAFVSYLLSVSLDGSGVIAVAVTGLICGSVYVKEKTILIKSLDSFVNFAGILVFILVGYIILPLSKDFFYNSAILFLAYLVIRYIALECSFGWHGLRFKEKMFVVLSQRKGIIIATVALFLAAGKGINDIFYIAIAFVVYSIIISEIVSLFAKKILYIK